MEYFISINNEKHGPYNLKELAERGLEATSLMMTTDGTNWTPAWQIDELRPILINGKESVYSSTATEANNKEEEPVIGQPAEEIPYVQASPMPQTNNVVQPTKRKSHAGCLISGFVMLAAIIALLIFTCPNAQDHKDALSDVVTATVNDAVQETSSSMEDDFLAKAFNAISKAFTGRVVKEAIDNLITVDNYFVCSIGKVNYDNKEHIVSVGLLNHIFTVDKDELKTAAEMYYKDAEVKVEQDLQKKVEQALRNNVIDPAAKAITDMIGTAFGGLLDELGISPDNNGSGVEDAMPADSI